MLIKEIMHKNPIIINQDVTLKSAYGLMQKNNLRHLPVTENDVLVGIVTDRDIRLSTSKLAENQIDPNDAVSKIMTSPVETTRPSEPIEVAAQIMRELKIGCMPVMDKSKIVGIVTGVDMLEAMLKLAGVHSPSGRLDVRLKDRTGEIARLTKIIAEKNVSIHSILSYQEENGKLRVALRISTMDIRQLAQAICSAGFEIIWPPKISCVE
ncbi:MAG: acetoin dehydrogenase [Ignavibacteriae bacterium]|nr:MAG: acetoin dehydrogenase [Ignavibacteriota bacterium]